MAATLRIDKWLWYTRVFKSRSLAAKYVASGRLRLSSDDRPTDRIDKPSHAIQVDDVLTFALHDKVFVLKVLALGTRRGPASEAVQLYEDLSPPPPKAKDALETAIESGGILTPIKGDGRPTKKARRTLDRFKELEHE